jgi:hypothetical protein
VRLLPAQGATLDDPGYFGEKLQAAHRQLLALWKRRCAQLQPSFGYTDIIGALLAANQLLEQSPNTSRKILMIFSDMRQNTADLDLESLRSVPSLASYEARSKLPVAELRGVSVYVVGADNARKSIAYWQALKEFWTEYFRRTGANLRGYSVLRELPVLAQQTR